MSNLRADVILLSAERNGASTGRVYQTASILQNTFTWDSSLLSGSSSWASAFAADFSQYNLGNDPVESSSPPTITIGQNLSIDPAGAYGTVKK